MLRYGKWQPSNSERWEQDAVEFLPQIRSGHLRIILQSKHGNNKQTVVDTEKVTKQVYRIPSFGSSRFPLFFFFFCGVFAPSFTSFAFMAIFAFAFAAGLFLVLLPPPPSFLGVTAAAGFLFFGTGLNSRVVSDRPSFSTLSFFPDPVFSSLPPLTISLSFFSPSAVFSPSPLFAFSPATASSASCWQPSDAFSWAHISAEL